MLKNLLHFGERRVIDVAVPRSDIIAFDDAGSFADLVALFREAGHSRIPVFTGSLDEVQGMIHVRDVYAHLAEDRKSVVWGKSVSVRVDLGGRRNIKKKKQSNNLYVDKKKHK